MPDRHDSTEPAARRKINFPLLQWDSRVIPNLLSFQLYGFTIFLMREEGKISVKQPPPVVGY